MNFKYKKSFIKKSGGFTLAETLITVAIVAMIASIIGAFQADIFSITSLIDTSIQNQSDARKILRPFVGEIRSATLSNIGAFPIATAGTSTLSFYTNIDGDDLKEQITYYLEGTEFKKSVIKPSGSPLVYDVDDAEVSTLVHDVLTLGESPIFEYFDETYNGTASTTPLTQPVAPIDVRLVKISILIDSDPNKPPEPFEVTTQVTIRNLKTSL